MQGVITKTVELVHFPLVDGIVPVHLKQCLGNGGNAVDVFVVEGDDSSAKDVGDVSNTIIFMPLALEFSDQTFLCLDSRLHAVEFDIAVVDNFREFLHGYFTQFQEFRVSLPVFLKQHTCMKVKTVVFHSLDVVIQSRTD